MSNVLQIDETGMVYNDCGSTKAKIGVTVGHRMADPETPDDRPHDLVILSIERAGSDEVDTVALTVEAARSVASALVGKACDAACPLSAAAPSE